MKHCLATILIPMILLSSCQEEQSINSKNTRFKSIDSKQSQINFRNDLVQNDSINIYTFRNFYNGAGVGLGDFNQDGLLDIFFAGNQVDNELYLNRGDFTFSNITQLAGVASQNVWTTGVSVVDINGDGWLDIYLCKSGDNRGENRHNELFINSGILKTKNGLDYVEFSEQSKEYGLNDIGLSTHAAFFDYDKDGDLDCYLLNNSYRTVGGYDLQPGLRDIRDPEGGNKLYRNDNTKGRNSFTDVSEEVGIYGSAIGFGLGVAISDLNGDGWPDIYVSNDFFEKDYMYINNADGTFSEQIEERTREISTGSMGADIADLTNDGKPEIFVTEMLPSDMKRYKTKVQFEDWNKYNRNIENGYFKQFPRNSLQLNIGQGQFSELSRYAGVDATDWSWGALIADYDADGYQDIFVANGIYVDLLDQDYINFFSNATNVREIINDPKKGILGLIKEMPTQPIANCLFTHTGDLRFSEFADDWGLGQKGFSNGAAYGDLDNDGTLDLVINNINAAPYIMRNNIIDNNYISIELKGSNMNTQAIGSKVHVYSDGELFYRELFPHRGFMSSIDSKIHIGLGNHSSIDSIIVTWPVHNQTSILKSIEVNQLITISQNSAQENHVLKPSPQKTLLTHQAEIDFKHEEKLFSDFDREPLLFSMHSTKGPACCSGDINKDGLIDFYIGGASGQVGKLFIQQRNGSFIKTGINKESKYEETDCIFFDATGNGFLDLYITSGSSEFSTGNAALLDQLYFNSNGQLTNSNQILPSFKFENSSSVDHFDFDLDGDEDLVVGINSTPFRYGIPNTTYILENDGKGKFTKLNAQQAGALENIGMISDVATGDLDKDGDDDLVVVGEWASPMYFENQNGTFFHNSNTLPNLTGFWHYVEINDIDEDGNADIILGNSGTNNQLKSDSKNPLRLYINDFDQNGKIEQILCIKEGSSYTPLHPRSELLKQLPVLAKSFTNYASFAQADVNDIIPKEILDKSLILEVQERRSGILKNKGNMNFEFVPFPKEAQYGPIYSGEVVDVNRDGLKDLLLGGNQYNIKPQFGIQDGTYGICLLSTGNGSLRNISFEESGLFEKGQIRGIVKVDNKLVIAKNNTNASLYEIN